MPLPLPEEFLARMERLLEAEYHEFLRSYQEPPVVGLRVNTLKVTLERFLELAPFDLTPIAWSPAAFLLTGDDQPGRHPYHAAGLYYLQDPSAMVVVELMDPQPGERVLDLAAAPGGKATHIASVMQNEGLLVANDIHPRRVWELAGNLERWGARNVAITNESPERLADRLEGFFDRVLVDAPCSGEGMFRKSGTARSEWEPALIWGCSVRQAVILNEAARMVRPGGLLCYSTCTFAPEENEAVIARFLREHPEFELIEPAPAPEFARGQPDWVEEGLRLPELERTVRLWPHRMIGEGHFVALLRRAGVPATDTTPTMPRRDVPGQIRQLFESFCREHLNEVPARDRLALLGAYLYQLPVGLPDLAGLRVIRPGWWLGTVRKNRFEPGHALAMALRAQDSCRVISLSANSEEVFAYLRGETLQVAGEDGWVIIAVDGFPLGWGKRVREIVKNRYPRGLRRYFLQS